MFKWIFKRWNAGWLIGRRNNCRECEFRKYQLASLLPFVLLMMLYHQWCSPFRSPHAGDATHQEFSESSMQKRVLSKPGWVASGEMACTWRWDGSHLSELICMRLLSPVLSLGHGLLAWVYLIAVIAECSCYRQGGFLQYRWSDTTLSRANRNGLCYVAEISWKFWWSKVCSSGTVIRGGLNSSGWSV